MPATVQLIEKTTTLGLEVVSVSVIASATPGPAGPGVPVGGTDGQVLTKTSATDYATAWEDPTGGGGASALVDLTDVTGEPPSTGEAPVWDGDSFELTDVATQAELDTHAADTTSIHGIADTTALALTANHPTNATFNDHSARHENGGADEISIAGLDGTPTELANHLADAADAHDASAISVLDSGAFYTATDVEGVLAEIAPQLGGGSGELLERDINQTAHGLAVGNLVRHNGTSYVRAQGNSAANAEVVGIVSAVADVDNFTLHYGGHITGLSGLTAGAVYYLDDDTAGLLTSTEPTDAGDISKPVLIADTTTSGYFFNWRGAVVVDMATQAELDAHVNDSSDAHDASAISFSAGGTISATDVQAAIEEVASEAGSATFAGARVKSSGDVALSNGAWTEITFNQEDFDTDGFHSTSSDTGRLTIPSGKAGKYHVGCNIEFTHSDTGGRGVRIRRNGTGNGIVSWFGDPAESSNDINRESISTIYDMAEGDYFTVDAFAGVAGLNAEASPEFSPIFWCYRLG